MSTESRHSMAWLEAIVRTSADAILSSDEQDVITTWNPAAAGLFGYTAEEAIGQPVFIIVPPELVETRRALLDQVRQGEPVQGLITRRRRKDGSLVDVQMTISAVYDAGGEFVGYSTILRDISEQLTAAEGQRELEHRYQTLIEKMPAVTYLQLPGDELGEFGLMTLSNRFEELSGYPLKAWLDDPSFTFKIMHPDDLDRVIAHDREVNSAGEPFVDEYRLITKDGRTIWVRDEAVLIRDDEGNRLYWLGIILDISDIKRAQAETALALASQQVLNAELQQASKARSQFLSMISHELRTPLTSIRGFSELIINEQLSHEEIVQFADAINSSAERLSWMITDLLEIDHLEAGQIGVNRVDLDLNHLLTQVSETFGPVTPRHSIVMKCDPALPTIQGDRGLLMRVFTNLVTNAIKYTPRGGEIVLETCRREAMVEVIVTDAGIGVPADARETIFGRYARLDRPEQQSIEGTGLGLPIARRIIELHGGKIWVETPANGIGSSFHVLLPERQGAAANLVPAGGTSGLPAPAPPNRASS